MPSPIQLVKYNISTNTGFLLDPPKESLSDYFSPWDKLARDMPDLVARGKLRDAVMRMPLLEHSRLEGYREHRLAHLQLGVIVTGFVWQDGPQGAPKVLPRCLSVPFYEVSRVLGLQPILSYCDLCLANWRYTDCHGSWDCLYSLPGGQEAMSFFRIAQGIEFQFAEGVRTTRNLPFEVVYQKPDATDDRCEDWCQFIDVQSWDCLYSLPGGQEAMSFFRIAQGIEFQFAEGVRPLQSILDGTDADDTALVTSGLEAMVAVLEGMNTWLLKMHDHLTAHVFYNVLRPFFEGWGHASSPLPEGLIYEGVSEEPIAVLGNTAAQNTGVALMDILFGVRHAPEKERFLKEMRNYMPPSHRQLLEDLERAPRSLLHMISENRNESLQTAYNDCLEALSTFRSSHLQMATKYIVIIARKNQGEKQKTIERGSGGSDIIPFLKDLRDDTKEMISSPAQQPH